MNDSGRVGPDPVTRSLLRRWPWVVIGLVVGLAVVAIYLISKKDEYTAKADVVVRPISQNAFSSSNSTPDKQLTMANEVVVGRSQAVLNAASSTLKNSISPTDLRDHSSVNNPTNTTVLQFAYTSSSKTTAADVANVLAQSYLSERQKQAQSILAAQTQSLQTSVNTLNQQLTSLTRQLDNLGANSPQRDSVITQLAQTTSALSTAQQQIATANAVDTTPGQLVEPASTPKHKDGPSTILLLIAGAIIGAILGFLAALAAVRLNKRVRHTYELNAIEGTGLVMSLPREGSRNAAEAWRLLAARLHNSGVGETYRSITITSPKNEANASSATALARALQEIGVTAHPSGPATAAVDGVNSVRVSVSPMTSGAAALNLFGQAAGAVVLVSRGTRWSRLHSLYGLLAEAGVPVIATGLMRGSGGRGDGDADRPAQPVRASENTQPVQTVPATTGSSYDS